MRVENGSTLKLGWKVWGLIVFFALLPVVLLSGWMGSIDDRLQVVEAQQKINTAKLGPVSTALDVAAAERKDGIATVKDNNRLLIRIKESIDALREEVKAAIH